LNTSVARIPTAPTLVSGAGEISPSEAGVAKAEVSMSYEVVNRWPDGREEVLYRRPSSDDSFRGEVKAMQQYLGIRCPYFIREIESPEANVEFKTDGKKAVEIADQGKPYGPAARRSAGSASRSGPSSGALAIGQAGAIQWR